MRAAKPFYLAVLGLTLSGCSALSQSPAPVVQGGQTRPATAYPDAYTPPPAPMASGSRGAVTVQAAPAGEVSVYRAKAPVKVSPASSTSTTTTASSTHIPAYPMNSSQAAPAPTPVPMGSRAPSSRDPDDDRPDSYKVFQRGRALAWLKGINVSCELLDEKDVIRIGPGGSRILPQ